jgi:hypothetical protein
MLKIFIRLKKNLINYKMDPIVITTLIISIGSLVTSVLTHIKYSSCCGLKVVSYHPNDISSKNNDSPTTPLLSPSNALLSASNALMFNNK